MTDKEVVRFLRCPASELVELAISRANLTERELQAVTLIGRRGMTQEAAAEQLDRSVDGVHLWYRSAVQKLALCWDGIWWVRKLID